VKRKFRIVKRENNIPVLGVCEYPMTQQPDWQHLAEQASKETDPRKMLHLIEELNRVLDEGRRPNFLLHQSERRFRPRSLDLRSRRCPTSLWSKLRFLWAFLACSGNKMIQKQQQPRPALRRKRNIATDQIDRPLDITLWFGDRGRPGL
jgi:hypothetical protein